MRACLKTIAVLLVTSFALSLPGLAQEKTECSNKKIYVKVAIPDKTDFSFLLRRPYKSAEMWLQEFMEFAVKVIKETAGDDVEVIPWEERIKRDDDPSTPEEENAFIKPVPGNYGFTLEVGLYSIDEKTGEREFWASASLSDCDLNGNYLETSSWHRPDVFIAIRSAIFRMSGRGFSYLLEEYEKTHFHSLRDPIIKIEVLDPGFVSPEPDEQKVKVEVGTKDCRKKFGEGTNLWFPSETDQGKAKPDKSSWWIKAGKTWWARTEKDGKMELEFQLQRGDDTRKIPIDVEIIGRGEKSIHQVVFIPVKTLRIQVEPEKDRVAPGHQTRVFVRLLKVDDKETKEPVKGRALTLKVTGLEDGTLEPKEKITTDENGLGMLTYTAGENDKAVTIEASYQPEGYETRFTGEGKINAGAYTVTVDLDMNSPFVADGRMSIAALGMHIVFDEVFFDPETGGGPFGGGNIRAARGLGEFTKFLLNDVDGEINDRHRPWFTKGPPKTIGAQLTMAADVGWLERNASEKNGRPVQPPPPPPASAPPPTAKLVFMTQMGPHGTVWQSHLGSAGLGDFRVQFEVPWRDLKAGIPLTVTVPYEAAEDSGDRGTWTIMFAPKEAKK